MHLRGSRCPGLRVVVVGALIREEHKVDTFEDGGFFSETLIRFCPTASDTSSEVNERSMNETIALGNLSAFSIRKIWAGSSTHFDL
jgi:hypothetical protein